MSEPMLLAEPATTRREEGRSPEPLGVLTRDELVGHHEASWGWALHCCEYREALAEDVLQSSYLKILEGRAAFRRRSSARTFLFGVIRNTAREALRLSRSRGGWLKRARDRSKRSDPSQTPEECIEARQELQMLRDLLNKLSERQRSVLHLVFYQELSVDEAAAVLEISVGSARQHYHRGKARLRSLLGN